MATEMTRKWSQAVLGFGLGLAVIGLGLLEVLLTEQTQFLGPRATVVNQTPLPNSSSEAGSAAPWKSHLLQVETSLIRGDVGAAERAWHDAYRTAFGSRRWDGLVEVGDAYLLIGEAAKGREVAEARARMLYLSALFRARQQGSLEGVLRTSEAFRALGDREVVEQGLRIAERLAAQTGGAETLERMHAFKERWDGLGLMAESANTVP